VAHLGEDTALTVTDPPRLIQQLQDFFRQRVQTLPAGGGAGLRPGECGAGGGR
jgi:predicted methyltransferase